MKLFKYGLPFAALALLASCSNDNLDQQGEVKPSLEEGTYMNITISLPNIVNSRADGDGLQTPNFDDGQASEYAVADGMVYLFKKSDGKLAASGELPTGAAPGNDDDITSTLHFYQIEINDGAAANWQKDNNEEYYALVILNTGGVTAPTAGQTYTQWAEGAQECTMIDESGNLTMTNALGWVGSTPSNEKPTWLVTLSANNLYTKATQNQAVPVEFFVQRGVAKITLGSSSNIKVKKAQEGVYTFDNVTGNSTHKVVLTNWDLDVKNTSTYPVQLIEQGTRKAFPASYEPSDWSNSTLTADYNRFLGGATFTRIYWALDPNYNSLDTHTMTTIAEANDDDHNAIKYCLENTFDLDNMDKDKSTRILFKAKYDIKGDGTCPSFLKCGNKYVEVDQDVLAKLNETDAGSYPASQLFQDDALDAMCKELGANYDTMIDYYVDGQCYYTIIIRHFADSELTDGLDEFYKNWSFTGSYGENYKNYLGRYGVVRNNSYEILINKISGPGTPDVPDPSDDPDDDPDPYKLDVTINILAWAQRRHSYDL